MAGQPTGEGAPQTRVLLLLKGAPGSGKSTLAARLAGALGWPLVDKDDARSSFQHLAPAHPGIDWNALSYEVMWRVVGTQLRCGLSVVVDCPLARRPLFDRAAALAGQHGARLALVELAPRDEAVWRRRVEQRGSCDAGTADAHKPGSWAEIEAIRERNNGSEAWSAAADVSLRCELDSTGSTLERQVQQVLVTLAAAGVQPAGAAAAAAAAMGEAAGVSGRGNIVTDRQ